MKREIFGSTLAVTAMATLLATSTAFSASSDDTVDKKAEQQGSSVNTMWQGLTLEQGIQLIGDDLVPLIRVRLQWNGELLDWLHESYSADPIADEHYLDDTVIAVTMPSGRPALSFLTWELDGFFRNLLAVDEAETIVLYRTPTGPANRDGVPVFEQALGITLPATAYADSELEYAARGIDDNDLAGLSASQARSPLAASGFNTYLGSFDGVSIYSNGSNGYNSKQSNYYNGYRTGLKWQCVEFTSRYFKAKFNRQIAGGNANSYYSSAFSKGLNRAPNGSSNKPRAGNLLCSAGNNAKGNVGHCAIIADVGSDSVKVVEQNWSNSTSDANKSHKLAMKAKKDKGGVTRYTVSGFSGSYPIQGWMWPCSGTCREYK